VIPTVRRRPAAPGGTRVSLRFTVQLLVFLLVGLLLVAVGVSVLARVHVADAARELRDRALPARQATGELAAAYTDQETGLRGFLLTGDGAFLEPYDAGRAHAERMRQELAEHLASDAGALAALRAVESAADAWHARAAGPAIAARQVGPLPEGELQAVAVTGKELFDDLRVELASLQQVTADRSAEQLAAVATSQRIANGVVAGAVGLALVVAAGSVLVLQHRLTRPLGRLLTDVQAVSEGDYDHDISRAGPREFATIGSSVDRMRDSIVEHGERLVGAQHELTLRTEHDRMAKDLHDLIIQRVFGLGLGLTSASRRHPELRPVVAPLIEETDRIIREVRTVIFDLGRSEATASLRSQVIDVTEQSIRALGFTPALEFAGPVDTLATEEVGAELLAVLREALSNVARHAAAGSASIRLGVSDGILSLTVTDDGVGLDPTRPQGNGLDNVRARAGNLGGTADIRPGEAGGTVVEWRVPIARS
jgi:signal transduction histidine kinase